MKIEYICPPPKYPKKPKGLHPLISGAWDYMVNVGGLINIADFDEDHSPIGPSLRKNLTDLGAKESTSGRTTIIYLEVVE